jgi:hypothetical protein
MTERYTRKEGEQIHLTSSEVIELKRQLLEPGVVEKLCAFGIARMLQEEHERSNEPLDIKFKLSQAALLGANWYKDITGALEMPGEEWPVNMADPSDIAATLHDMVIASEQQNG